MALDEDTVAAVDAALDLYHYLEPVNADEERQRFMDAAAAGNEYTPSYRYRAFEEQDTVEDRIDRLEERVETRLERSVVAALRSRLRMITAIGSDDITTASQEHYGRPSDALVAAARDRFTPPEDGPDRVIDSGDLAAAFNALFDRLDTGYSAEADDNAIIRNTPHESCIRVPGEKSYPRDVAKRLLVHESTHAVRTVNGRTTGNPALVHGTRGYEAAEEGLATFNEAAMDVLHTSLPKITARVIAVAGADDGFHALYRRMRELGLDSRSAYVRAYRVKRGLKDTSRAGGFIKDHIYFAGYRQLDDASGLAEQLYRGKIGFDDAEIEAVETVPRIGRDQHLDACAAVIEEVLA